MSPVRPAFRIVWPALGLVGLWLFLVTPLSPLALSRGDVALGQGDAGKAVRIYDRVADWCVLASTRQRALERSAAVYASELNDPEQARRRWSALLVHTDDAAERARVHHRIAEQWMATRHPEQAARSWEAAYQDDPEYAEYLALSGRALVLAGRPRRALATWSRVVREHPEWRGEANLARAQVHLSRGSVDEALPLFEDAAAHGDPEVAAVARLGSATCLERMGSLDEALAALDLAGLPQDVHRRRADAIQARAVWSGEPSQ